MSVKVLKFQGKIKTGASNLRREGLAPFLFGRGCHQKEETMTQEAEEATLETTPEPSTELKPDYDLHIKVPAEMRPILKDSAQLAHKMGDIPKPELVDLMNLFIGWGLTILKKKWLDRVGYR